MATLAATLTPKEIRVTELAALGLDYNESAKALFISPNTVRRHLANSREKFHAKNTTHLVAMALSHGLIKLALCIVILVQAAGMNPAAIRRPPVRPPVAARQMSRSRNTDLLQQAAIRT